MSRPRVERAEIPEQALLRVLAGAQAGIWTALPAVITKVNLTNMTVEAVPTIQCRVRQPDQSYVWHTLPVIPDVPIVFPSGGGFTLTFPVAEGDECLLLFSSRCIDSWWDSSGIQQQADFRMHDLSDGFALVGPRSRPRALSGVSSTDVVLRNDAGSSSISIKADGSITMVAPTIDITGTLRNNGHLVGSTHTHSGVRAGGDVSGAPL